jgi:DNA-directed RNA polymerase specialized sigma24 family protein
MARIEWVKHRLNNWATWKARESAGGMGYAKQSAFLREVVDGYREVHIPVDDVDASTTDVAVESLRQGKGHLYMTLQLVYVKGVGHREAARLMARAESTIKANLEQADHALREWFNGKAERDAAKRKNYQGLQGTL